MDPLHPVDPDEEVPRNTAEESSTNDTDVETSAEIRSAAAPERRPAADRFELIDESVSVEPDSIILPPASEVSSTTVGPASPDGSDVVAMDPAPEPQSAFVDSTPAATEADPGLNAGQLPSIEPVGLAPLPDVISPPDNIGSSASADRAIPGDSWPGFNNTFDAALQQTPLPAIALGSTDSPISSSETDSFRDRLSLTVDPEPSLEGIPDDQEKHDVAPITGGGSGSADSRPRLSLIEREKAVARREEIERFIENFRAQTARTDALFSPSADGGPPMARPIVLVSLDEEQMQAITNDALAESVARTAKSAAELAQEKVDEAFWLRDCEMRALLGGR